jgi:hypothetical protein
MDRDHKIIEDFRSETPVPFEEILHYPLYKIIPAHGMISHINPDVTEVPEYVFSPLALPKPDDFDSRDFQIAADIEAFRQFLALGYLPLNSRPQREFVEMLGGWDVITPAEYWRRTYEPLIDLEK